jgi:hypothetical protein
VLESNDTELDLGSLSVYDQSFLLEIEEEVSLALAQPEYLVLEIQDEVSLALAQPEYHDELTFEAVGIDSAFMKEVGTQALLMHAEQYIANLPEPIKLLRSSESSLHRRQVKQVRQHHLGGMTTLILSLAALVVCLAVLSNMLGRGSSSPTEQSQQGYRRSSSTGSMVLPVDTISYTRAQWATDLLKAIGNSNPSLKTIYWVVGWTDYESSAGGAAYNLLNTTQRMPGGWDFNSVGVQNYTSYSQGIKANAIVLENGYYPTLLAALQSNDLSSLASPPASIQSELGTWGTGWRSWGFSGARANETFS